MTNFITPYGEKIFLTNFITPLSKKTLKTNFIIPYGEKRYLGLAISPLLTVDKKPWLT